MNTAFDVNGTTHIHACFLPWVFRRRTINNCQLISISQHLRACQPGRSASTCSRTHTFGCSRGAALCKPQILVSWSNGGKTEGSSCRTHQVQGNPVTKLRVERPEEMHTPLSVKCKAVKTVLCMTEKHNEGEAEQRGPGRLRG